MAIAADVQRGMADSSWIRRMFELGIELRRERGAENVFDLSLGNPIAEPPVEFFDALRELAAAPAAGSHRYMPNAGYPDTRQASPTRCRRDRPGLRRRGHRDDGRRGGRAECRRSIRCATGTTRW